MNYLYARMLMEKETGFLNMHMHEMHLNQNHKPQIMEWVVRYIPIPMLQKKI